MAVGIDMTAQGSARRRKPPLGTPADTPKIAILEARPEDVRGEVATRPQPMFDAEAYAREPVAVPMNSRSAPAAPSGTQPALPTDREDATEREGGAIPTTSDVWRSQQDAAEFERRIETLQTEEQIRQLRDTAAQHAARAEIARREGGQLVSQAGIAERRGELRTREAGVLEERVGAATERVALLEDQAAHIEMESVERASIERDLTSGRADVLRQTGEIRAADERRQAELAGLSKEQRNAQLTAFVADASAQQAELRIEHLEEAAQMRVIGAAKGTGGAYTERLVQSAAGRMERKVGRIGAQVEARRRLRDIGVQADDIRMEGAAARAAHIETVSEMEAFLTEHTGQRRATLTELQGTLDARAKRVQAREAGTEEERIRLEADEARLAAEVDGLQADNLRIQAAQTFLRSDAERKSADYAATAARISDWALDNRPPIPDYIAIGKKQDRAQTIRNVGTAVGVIGGVASLGRSFGLW